MGQDERTAAKASPSHEAGARISRRRLLTAAGATAAAVGVPGALANVAAAHDDDDRWTDRRWGSGRDRIPRERISIQLFTLRDQLAIDFEGTLRRLGEIGYRRVEHAGFVGRTVEQFKAALDAAGLRATSGHVQIPQPFDAAAWSASLEDAVTLGSRYIVFPGGFGVDFAAGTVARDSATWRAFARDLNRAGQMARRVGLRFGYHNHNWEFFRLTDDPSRTVYDLLVEETDPRYVHFELDLFWAWRGAHDPVDLLRRIDGRVRQYHVKDMDLGLPVPVPSLAFDFADPGRGLIDFVRIFQAHEVEEYIVERDDAGTPPRTSAQALDTARIGYEFLAHLSLRRS
jgi:sugar phosphate isomerase/epimerase